jgi:2-keto-3-deoxy-L-rhamnonate aldolase RhmA
MTRIGARQRFGEIIDAGRVPVGMFIGSSDAAIVDILGDVGFDFALFDAEHSPLGPAEFVGHVRAAEAAGIVPMVRMPDYSRVAVQRFLDVGAEALVISHIETADEARAALETTRFPPAGSRSMCPSTHSGRYSMGGWGDFVEHTERNVLVIPIIESRLGVKNIDEILGVEGIDYVLFGPGDFSVDVGASFDSSEVTEGWAAVKAAAVAHGKRAITTTNCAGLARGEADVLVHGMDLLLVHSFLTDELASVRTTFEH